MMVQQTELHKTTWTQRPRKTQGLKDTQGDKDAQGHKEEEARTRRQLFVTEFVNAQPAIPVEMLGITLASFYTTVHDSDTVAVLTPSNTMESPTPGRNAADDDDDDDDGDILGTCSARSSP